MEKGFCKTCSYQFIRSDQEGFRRQTSMATLYYDSRRGVFCNKFQPLACSSMATFLRSPWRSPQTVGVRG